MSTDAAVSVESPIMTPITPRSLTAMGRCMERQRIHLVLGSGAERVRNAACLDVAERGGRRARVSMWSTGS